MVEGGASGIDKDRHWTLDDGENEGGGGRAREVEGGASGFFIFF